MGVQGVLIMKSSKTVIMPGVFTALLIASQFALSAVSGIEIVTILFLCFCYVYGVKQGLFVANAFSLIRCLVFGFNLNVLILYLVYFNLFALGFGGLGNAFKKKYSIKIHAIVIAVCVLYTLAFTMLDNVITPIFYGFTLNATKGYFYASLYTLVPHLACSFTTTLLLFLPIIKILKL